MFPDLDEFETIQIEVPRGSARERLRAEKRNAKKLLCARIRKALIEKPFASFQEIRDMFSCNYGTIQSVAEQLKQEGFYRDLEREIILAEYAQAHPNATKKDAAKHFGTNVFRIHNTKGATALRNHPPKVKPKQFTTSASGEDWPCNSEVDQEMEAQLYLRPAWYVEEVRKNGFLGVCLPENEFKLYLELREKHRKQGSRIFMVERKSE